MKYFVDENSVVREIWGKSETILFIFVGASAEFALNKAVDWLYFTGRLPADPLGRLFSTVAYARQIIFSNLEAANRAIDKMASIHAGVESNRGASIPDWAYRDVLFMLIDYSIRAYEIMERKMTEAEKTETFLVFYRVGSRMGLKELPATYQEWKVAREEHLVQDLQKSRYTEDLFRQYRKHLGLFRYTVLLQAQTLIVPETAKQMLKLNKISLLSPVIRVYKLSRALRLEGLIKNVLLPSKIKSEVKGLDSVPA